MGYLTSAGSVARMFGPPYATTIFSYSGFRTYPVFCTAIGLMLIALVITARFWTTLDPNYKPGAQQGGTDQLGMKVGRKIQDKVGMHKRQASAGESACLLIPGVTDEGDDTSLLIGSGPQGADDDGVHVRGGGVGCKKGKAPMEVVCKESVGCEY